MANERLAQLRSMLAEEPGDKFLRYAIALERKREGDMESAATELEELLREDPAYIACYYQLALVLADVGRTADAADVCKAGALKCLVTGDGKARAELLALLSGLEGEDEGEE
jgi:thioredoxin-like negative regulator of GroEL